MKKDKNIKNKRATNDSFLWQVLIFLIVVCGIFVLWLLLSIIDKFKSYNEIFWKVLLFVVIILFIRFYVYPIISVFKMDYYDIGIEGDTTLATKHNANVRKRVAKRIINDNEHSWYDKNEVEELKNALDENIDTKIYKSLKYLMDNSIKKTSNKIITESAISSGVFTALAQSQQFDAIIVLIKNFNMVKDLLYLYGYRPSKAKLLMIFSRVAIASIVAFNIQGSAISTLIGKGLTKLLPFVKDFASYASDASFQFVVNSGLSMNIGFNTIKCLNEDYNLQALVKGVDVLDEEELQKNKKDIEKAIDNEMIKIKIPFLNFTKKVEEIND